MHRNRRSQFADCFSWTLRNAALTFPGGTVLDREQETVGVADQPKRVEMCLSKGLRQEGLPSDN